MIGASSGTEDSWFCIFVANFVEALIEKCPIRQRLRQRLPTKFSAPLTFATGSSWSPVQKVFFSWGGRSRAAIWDHFFTSMGRSLMLRKETWPWSPWSARQPRLDFANRGIFENLLFATRALKSSLPSTYSRYFTPLT